MDCIFCKIISGDIPCYKVYEDDFVLGFLDIDPNTNGHTLLIPKKHILDLDEISLEDLSKINIAAKKVKKLLEEKLNCDGIIIQQNNGCVQEVKHYHMHVKPIYSKEQKLIDVRDVYEKIKN